MVRRIYFLDGILFLMFLLFSLLSPWALIFWLWGVPKDIDIEPTFINGLITFSGILTGFITTAVARQPRLPFSILLMIFANWALLLYAATDVLRCAVGQTNPIFAIIEIMRSIFSNHFTAGSLIILNLSGRRQD